MEVCSVFITFDRTVSLSFADNIPLIMGVSIGGVLFLMTIAIILMMVAMYTRRRRQRRRGFKSSSRFGHIRFNSTVRNVPLICL